ncbi:MAG: VanZ family protein [Bacteroidia bacterium]|nr:VanZ family protein [Bacteroidia bacterium]
MQIDYFPHQDKVVHIVFYLVLTFIIRINLKSNQNVLHAKAIMMAVLYSMILEFIQEWFITGRHFDYFDIIANIIGSLTGSCIYYLLRKQNHNG